MFYVLTSLALLASADAQFSFSTVVTSVTSTVTPVVFQTTPGMTAFHGA